jgi:aminoglycoside phosphotransferase (APT) family kinase protein
MSQAIALAERAGDRDRAATLRAARPAYAQAARRLRALPEGLIHGELYASNILIDDARAPSALRLIDWETTTVACPLLDVAALSSGWDPASRLRIAQAWARGAERADKRLVQGIDLDRDLACAHLVLATRWLGWATDWSPPPRERYDWMRELDQAVAVVTGAARP